MKNKKGFTLIELLAVIVILGLLMAIAIPSVTKYITQSRKKTITSTISNYIGALVNDVNDLSYTFTETNTVYAVPIECIALERGGTNPFGYWLHANDAYWAYVLVQYDDNTSSYTYGYTFKDSAGYGLYPTSQAKLNESGKQIQTGLNLNKPVSGKVITIASVEKWSGFVVNASTNLVVLTAAKEGKTGDGVTTCTLQQKGENYASIVESAYPSNAASLTSSMSEAEVANTILSSSAVVLKGNVKVPSSLELVQDVTVYSAGDYTMTFNNTSFIKGNGTMTIKGGNIKAPKEFVVSGNATLAIEEGIHSFGLVSIVGNGVLTVNGGTISTHGYGECGDIVMGGNATLNVKGGKLVFDGGWDWEINLTANNVGSNAPTNIHVNITGGEIDAVSGVLFSARSGLNNSSNTHINITGGTIKNAYHVVMDWGSWGAATWTAGIPTISGGTFIGENSGDYANYIADGYKAVINSDESISIVKN